MLPQVVAEAVSQVCVQALVQALQLAELKALWLAELWELVGFLSAGCTGQPRLSYPARPPDYTSFSPAAGRK